MSILVDSSVWVDYFRGTGLSSDHLDLLIEENLVVTNDLILAELLPPPLFAGRSSLCSC